MAPPSNLPGSCLLALFLLAAPCIGGDRPAIGSAEILARIQAPQFPERDFPITDFGAVADADCSEALAKAISACNSAGGGRVVVPAGIWLTGPVTLKSNVNLRISEGATLRFLPEPGKYMPPVLTRFEGIECMNFSPLIYAFGQENIAVTGSGTLDGSASLENWWAWSAKTPGWETMQARDRKQLDQEGADGTPVDQRVFGLGHFLRPNFIQPYRCKNVLIEGVTIIRSPMWEIHPALCTNVTVRGVSIHSLGANNDGCDPESCHDVLIEDCVFETGDDCIAIKSGRNNDGRRVGVPTENVVIRRCTMKDGHGGVTIGSEISGGCRNVFIEDCAMDSPNLERAFRFKSNAVRGGVIENVFVRRVKIGRVARAILSVEFDYEEGANGPFKPVLRNVVIENVIAESSARVLAIAGFPGTVIEGMRLRDCVFRGVDDADSLKDSGALTLENVTIQPSKKREEIKPPRAGSGAPESGARPADVSVHEPQAPSIPVRAFAITAYGALGDGKTMNTDAFRAAIQACVKAGGGRVVVPAGTFVTGPIELASHMALVLEKGAVIQASDKFSDFGLPDPLPATQSEINALRKQLQPLISGSKLEDVAILGEGTIDGAGAVWWAKSDKAAERAALPPAPIQSAQPGGKAKPPAKPLYVPRPHLVVLRDCARVHVQGVTLGNSPMFHLVPARCRDVLVEDVSIHAPADSPNTDGIDPANCRDVVIRRCTIDTGDDDIALKAGAGGGYPTENVTVSDCKFLHGHGVSVGSEVQTGVRHFLVQRCAFENTGTALRIKSDRTRGGVVEDVTYRDITMKNVEEAITVFLFYDNKKTALAPAPKPVTADTPIIRNIHFLNIACEGATRKGGEIIGLPESPVSDVTLENVRITGAVDGFTQQDVKNLRLINVDVQTLPAAAPEAKAAP